MDLRLNNFYGGALPEIFGALNEELDEAIEGADYRLLEVVFEAIKQIGKNEQLLELEQVELAKEKSRLEEDIKQLKMTHLAEWEACHQAYFAKMLVESEKLKPIVDRFKWIKASFEVQTPEFTANLRSLVSSNLVSQGYYKAEGKVHFRTINDGALSDEGCESVFADWLQLVVDQAITTKRMDYDRDSNPAPAIPQLAPPKQENALEMIVPVADLIAPSPMELKLRKITHANVESYHALKSDTAKMRDSNEILRKQKDMIIEEHRKNLDYQNFLFAVKFKENLDKARLFLSQTEKNINFCDSLKGKALQNHRGITEPLTEERFNLVKEGFVQETELFQGLVRPLISTLEEFFTEYGKLACKDEKVSYEEQINQTLKMMEWGRAIVELAQMGVRF